MIFTLENLRYLTLWLNRLSMLLGFIIGMGYTYLAMPGPMGIVGGLLTASAHLMLMWITSNNALGYTAHTAYPGVVITLGILATLLSSFSVFIHTYYSMMLLAPLLPLPTVFILGLSILIAVCCTVSNLLFSAVQLSRPYRETPAWMEQKILSFSNVTSVLHTLITLGHIWALEGSISSFCMGLILSLCDLIVLYLFNHHLLISSTPAAPAQTATTFSDTAQRYAYMGLCVICILGSKIGSCIVYYQGTMLLGLALGFPVSFVLAMAVSTATIATFAGILFSTSQAYDLYKRFFPAPAPAPTVTEDIPEPALLAPQF